MIEMKADATKQQWINCYHIWDSAEMIILEYVGLVWN